ncbi:MAG: hypothetical protein QF830_04655 [Rhodospirillales bacterium]|jgi:hypothetical protein|nr:hypothetical protein [Rhodospirillales bacterium]MDP6883405.1 hypothetical protein [Rhodospirillales bacterium]
MKRISAILTVIVPAALLAACGYVSEYEKGVHDYEPVYCYQSLAGIQCFDKPNHRDEKRLVNYYGPAPSRFDRPEPPAPATLHAPPAVDFYVRDREPVPAPAAPRQTTRLPWLKCAAASPAAGPSPRVAAPISSPVLATAVETPGQPLEHD